MYSLILLTRLLSTDINVFPLCLSVVRAYLPYDKVVHQNNNYKALCFLNRGHGVDMAS